MKGFAKFIRIIFMILGISMAAGITAMLVIPGASGITDSDQLIMPVWLVYTIFILVDIFCVFLFVYNIICLVKGIDVFFWLIFRHQRYVNGEYKKDYNKKKYTSTPKPTTSSGSYSKDSTPKSYGGTTNFDKLNSGPSSSGGGKPGHEFGWAEISNVVKSAGRNQIWGFNAYVSVDDCYVKEVGDYDFRIEVEFKVTGSATIKDSVDASRFKSGLANAQKYLFQTIEERLYPKYQKYGFGYEIKVTRCDTSDLKVTNY